jgi:hypothetical protein
MIKKRLNRLHFIVLLIRIVVGGEQKGLALKKDCMTAEKI